MSAQARRPRCAPLLAMLAVALLSWAGVRSPVMQAAMAMSAGMADCAEMAGMAAAARPHAPKSAPARPAACPWCAAAAHPPLQVVVTSPVSAGHAVAFAAYASPRASGPRGPPARRPSARDPPPFSA